MDYKLAAAFMVAAASLSELQSTKDTSSLI